MIRISIMYVKLQMRNAQTFFCIFICTNFNIICFMYDIIMDMSHYTKILLIIHIFSISLFVIFILIGWSCHYLHRPYFEMLYFTLKLYNQIKRNKFESVSNLAVGRFISMFLALFLAIMAVYTGARKSLLTHPV